MARVFLRESQWDFDVVWAPSCARARDAFSRDPFDAFLIDHRLPDGTGLDLIADLRARQLGPIIMITGMASKELDYQAMVAGVDEFLLKGAIAPELLERTVRYAIERRRAVAALRQSEERFRALVAHSSDAIMLIDREGTIRWVSDGACQLTGFEQGELVGRSAFADIHPEDLETIRQAFQETLQRPGIPVKARYRACHKSGEWRNREGTGANRLDDPAVKAVVVNYRDVTDRERADEQRAHLAAIVESSQDAIVGKTLDGTILSWNEGAERLYGYTADEMRGASIFALVPPERHEELQSILLRLRSGKTVRRYETARLTKAGRVIDLSVSISPIRDNTGAVVGASTVERDISDRKRAEAALRENERRLRFAMEAACMGVWEHDVVSDVVECFDGMTSVFGVPSDRFPATFQEFLQLVHADDRQHVTTCIKESVRSGLDCTMEFRTIWPDQSVHFIEGHGRALRDDHGASLKIFGIGVDVTQRRQLQEQYRQAQKMEAVGQLAGGVAHDFNNLLTVMLGNAEMLSTGETAPEERDEDIAQIIHAGNRAVALTSQLLAFSRKQVLQPTIVDLNSLVESTTTMLRRLIGENFDLRVRLGATASPIYVDPGQIEQVLMNLVINARDAMTDGGTITIQTEGVTLDEAYIHKHTGARAGRYTKLTVSDTGVGMDAQTRSRIFEPFFTTKEKGKGTGLGLATVYGIVKQSGGYIAVASEPGAGASFEVYLPNANQEVLSPSGVIDFDAGAHRGETILLVEDEDSVRHLVRTLLNRRGYLVLDAANAADAINVVRNANRPIDLLLTDVVMPGQSGPMLFEQLSPQNPDMAVIYMSGYPDETLVDHGTLDSAIAYLQKPFSATALMKKIREVLD